MKERFVENNIEYILAEDGIYYPNLQLPEDNETRPIGLYGSLRKSYIKASPCFIYGLDPVWYSNKTPYC
jgi:hypothetical protein